MTIAADSTAATPVLLPLRTFLKQYAISKSEFPAASALAWRPARDRDQLGAAERGGCGMSAGRRAVRFSLRAVLALPTLVGFVWPLARLAGSGLAALLGSAGSCEGPRAHWYNLSVGAMAHQGGETDEHLQ
jgi:hypothetical protein